MGLVSIINRLFLAGVLISSTPVYGKDQISNTGEQTYRKLYRELEFSQKFFGAEGYSESNSEFAKALKKTGIKRVLIDDSRDPTTDEIKEIKIGFENAPYCAYLINQIIIEFQEFGYGGSADFPRTISIELPKQREDLDELINEDKELKSVWKTKREDLRSTPLHECAHKIEMLILEYFSKGEVMDTLISIDIPEHPLYIAFAKLEGLRYDGKKYIINDNRLGSNYTIGINQYFAELYAISRLLPKVLTDAERKFFDKLHTGLMNYGEKFLADVAKNPEILLK